MVRLTVYLWYNRSTTLAWTIFALSINSASQAKLRKELVNFPKEIPTTDELNSLKYLDNVVREVLRLYSPVPTTQRAAVHADVIPLSKPFVDVNGQKRDYIECVAEFYFLRQNYGLARSQSQTGRCFHDTISRS